MSECNIKKLFIILSSPSGGKVITPLGLVWQMLLGGKLQASLTKSNQKMYLSNLEKVRWRIDPVVVAIFFCAAFHPRTLLRF
jgi:hypothetical protein